MIAHILYMILATQAHAQANSAYIRDIIVQEAIIQGLDAEIAVAIAKIESSLNPNAVGPKGEIGLFQVRPEHSKIRDLFNPRANAREGIRILIHYKAICPAQTNLQWVTCFNSGIRHPRYPQLLPYYKRFMSEYASR